MDKYEEAASWVISKVYGQTIHKDHPACFITEALTALREYRDENARLREFLERIYCDDIFDVTIREIAREALKGN